VSAAILVLGEDAGLVGMRLCIGFRLSRCDNGGQPFRTRKQPLFNPTVGLIPGRPDSAPIRAPQDLEVPPRNQVKPTRYTTAGQRAYAARMARDAAILSELERQWRAEEGAE